MILWKQYGCELSADISVSTAHNVDDTLRTILSRFRGNYVYSMWTGELQSQILPGMLHPCNTMDVSTNDTVHDCKNPLYTNCRTHGTSHLCCGPDQYCCNKNLACCRRNPWTVYEIVGLITGILSWICLSIVLAICVGIRCVKVVIKRCRKKKRIYPHPDNLGTNVYEMKYLQ